MLLPCGMWADFWMECIDAYLFCFAFGRNIVELIECIHAVKQLYIYCCCQLAIRMIEAALIFLKTENHAAEAYQPKNVHNFALNIYIERVCVSIECMRMVNYELFFRQGQIRTKVYKLCTKPIPTDQQI